LLSFCFVFDVYFCFIYATVYLCAGRHDTLFVVGSLNEIVMLWSMRYHSIDIETSVLRSHRKICEWYVRKMCDLLAVVSLSLNILNFFDWFNGTKAFIERKREYLTKAALGIITVLYSNTFSHEPIVIHLLLFL